MSGVTRACGCGEDQIPWMLAKFGVLGAAALVTGVLVVMIAAGWALASVVWLARRRRTAPRPAEEDGLGSFSWSDREP
ncbi:hypothetical protein [Streptomyces sp. NPDC049590]|uniref:hypothetical protein n=1 Tax=Streptomyces sp. NPDC049590 TaxID=3154834 RepID=UPI0034272057